MYQTTDSRASIISAIHRGIGALRFHGASAEAIEDLETAAQRLWTLPAAPSTSSTDWAGETPLEVLALDLPPIAGGAPYQPTPSDWEDYAAWSDALDRDHEADAIHRDMYGF